ncbi:hypothetical protein K466DRAFT_600309 [Polyporus arcularius HHB13444]|uniref:Fungal-type protein kinase domain-containing protein n=1 Tax=Polyporus arcularius HHB13444 TaxID=1314778 RepID=A0A5C3P9Z2_9APHY|nr:hypothetical protein K466DRAFT_600309 [Polyporus arcularius HHB13444]
MPKHVFDALVNHLRGHVPTEYDNPSPMLLNVIMLRITCILSNPEETVVLVPEWSIINAAAWGEKPPMCDVVHHLVIRGSERAAVSITFSPISTLQGNNDFMDKLHMAHIFEAKTMPGFEDALPYAVKQMAYWCKMTGRRYSKAAIYFDFKWRFLTYDAVGLPGEDRPLVRIMGGMGRPWYVLLTAQDIDTTLGLLLDMVENASEENLQFFRPRDDLIGLLN